MGGLTHIIIILIKKLIIKYENWEIMEEEIKAILVAIIILAIIDGFLLINRLLGNIIFQLLFEILIFYFPLIILIAYLLYLIFRG
jgi:hypothetical protein